MQTLTLSSNATNGRLLGSSHSLRLRAFRSLSERYAQRERPSVIAEFSLFGAIVGIATWAIVSLGHAMTLIR
ncbi:MAG: hypothetical protein H0X40_11250 [Chthoniobacterales bacterium]|nr:hypothetical protein [Chthoniobacterales bacterium]